MPASTRDTDSGLSEFERAQLLILMTQTSLLSVIAAAADSNKTSAATDQLCEDLSRHTPNIAKWLIVGGRR